jgi:uncharacterized membrane protein
MIGASNMDSFTKQMLIVMVGIVAIVSSIALSISSYMTTTTCMAMEQGYSMEVLPGSSSPQWVKK